MRSITFLTLMCLPQAVLAGPVTDAVTAACRGPVAKAIAAARRERPKIHPVAKVQPEQCEDDSCPVDRPSSRPSTKRVLIRLRR